MNSGWNPLPRDGWRKAAALIGRTPTAAELYMWLHTVVESGFYVSPALSTLAVQIAALGDFDAAHVDRVLAELERRGLLEREGCSFCLPDCLSDTSAAPSSPHSVKRVALRVGQLGLVLRRRVTHLLLDVTARADLERERRRKDDVKEPIFEQLKRALGVQLVSLPEEPADPQLSLPFAAARLEVRIVPKDPPEKGDYLDYFEASAAAESGRPVTAQSGHIAAALPRIERSAPPGGVARAGVHPGPGRGDGPVAAGREKGAAALRDAGGAVSGVVRADQARCKEQLERFIERSRDPGGVARFLADVDERSAYEFDEACKRVGATQDDRDKMAEMLASGEAYRYRRGMTLQQCKKPFLVDAPDYFRDLCREARTPARKPQARNEQRIHPVAQALLDGIQEELKQETANARK